MCEIESHDVVQTSLDCLDFTTSLPQPLLKAEITDGSHCYTCFKYCFVGHIF